jgi:hypothetical protein
MLFIPTHVRVPADDPELARATYVLLTELRAQGRFEEGDLAQPNEGRSWQYLCSTPYGRADGSVAYLHIFRHACHPSTGRPLTLSVPATASWWPDAGCEILQLPKTTVRARLRLVS